jgi:hypothetical protein
VVEAEVLRHAAAPAARGEEGTPLFWRIFGTTILSIAALVAVTLYQQLSGAVAELRVKCQAISESSGDLVKKDEYNSHNLAVANSLKEVQANNAAALDLWRERARELERQIKLDKDEYKQQLRELARESQRLRERLAVLESRPVPGGAPARAEGVRQP